MDKKDNLIIEELKKDSRQSIRDIAEKTKLRPSTVHNRIKKLSEENIIERFTVKLNNKKLGRGFIVFVLVNTDKNIPNTFFADHHIEEVHGVTGEYDLIFKCRFKDIDEFNKFIIKLRETPQVRETRTMVGTLTLKES